MSFVIDSDGLKLNLKSAQMVKVYFLALIKSNYWIMQTKLR